LIRLLAVVPSQYDTAPGQRFRLEQWAPHLAANGIEIGFAPFETAELHAVLYREGHRLDKIAGIATAFARRFETVRAARTADVVYLFREAALLGPAIIERLLARTGVPMVFDFDDAVFEAYKSPSNGYLSLLKFPRKTATICRLSTHVLAGSPYLAEYARRYNNHVTVVPTTIDTERYQPQPRSTGGPIFIGWSGSHSTVQHLRRVDRALQRLATTRNFQLRVIGTNAYSVQGISVDAMPWRSETEVDDLRRIDIGIMPLPDDRWSRGKCALKALQYMALGIPTVCSPVGVNTDIIQHGENGLLAGSDDEWVESLSRLIDSKPLRERLGAAGRGTVESKYSSAVQAPIVSDLLQSVARTRP
jgi:glycosyltransferase involved in cell wall biosynthesis